MLQIKPHFLLLLLLVILSCEKAEISTQSRGIVDVRDGNEYDTVLIGNQIWMAENLKFLPSVTIPVDAGYRVHYFVYDNYSKNLEEVINQKNYNEYGGLYNRWAMQKDVCPAGWHVPDDEEWEQLIEFLGGTALASQKMKDTDGLWESQADLLITNESGFSAIPGGRMSSGASEYQGLGDYAVFWSSTNYNGSYTRDYMGSGISLSTKYDTVNHWKGVQVFGLAYSVRCIKDSPE